ncbi:unnamed protein product [Brassica rapa]|nr:unnamed protein product [Brassica napus]CAG7901680.1 unnamed protein product [Brassica rapa]CDY15684.1 BnaA07g08550D [Brassica napus]VDC97244.1 unnamed protein product [Brassica rapa]
MGGVKLLLIFGLLILAMVATSVNATYPLTKSCINGQGCIGDDDELESLMDSETNRRQLARGRRYIGYDALKKNNVPCNRRGRSYYDCKKRRRNNPYRRGCSAITHCYRFLEESGIFRCPFTIMHMRSLLKDTRSVFEDQSRGFLDGKGSVSVAFASLMKMKLR